MLFTSNIKNDFSIVELLTSYFKKNLAGYSTTLVNEDLWIEHSFVRKFSSQVLLQKRKNIPTQTSVITPQTPVQDVAFSIHGIIVGVANNIKKVAVFAIAIAVATLFGPAIVANSVMPTPCQDNIKTPATRTAATKAHDRFVDGVSP